jgi:hypothetical protein
MRASLSFTPCQRKRWPGASFGDWRRLGFLAGAAMLCLAAGCGHYTILTVPAISMTTPSLPPGAVAAPAGRITSEFCPGDDPAVSHDDNVGLIDEAVARAQRKAGAQYLSDVTIASDGMCVYVDAMAMR